jgi:hypothetical protein
LPINDAAHLHENPLELVESIWHKPLFKHGLLAHGLLFGMIGKSTLRAVVVDDDDDDDDVLRIRLLSKLLSSLSFGSLGLLVALVVDIVVGLFVDEPFNSSLIRLFISALLGLVGATFDVVLGVFLISSRPLYDLVVVANGSAVVFFFKKNRFNCSSSYSSSGTSS